MSVSHFFCRQVYVHETFDNLTESPLLRIRKYLCAVTDTNVPNKTCTFARYIISMNKTSNYISL